MRKGYSGHVGGTVLAHTTYMPIPRGAASDFRSADQLERQDWQNRTGNIYHRAKGSYVDRFGDRNIKTVCHKTIVQAVEPRDGSRPCERCYREDVS